MRTIGYIDGMAWAMERDREGQIIVHGSFNSPVDKGFRAVKDS